MCGTIPEIPQMFDSKQLRTAVFVSGLDRQTDRRFMSHKFLKFGQKKNYLKLNSMMFIKQVDVMLMMGFILSCLKRVCVFAVGAGAILQQQDHL